MKKLLLILLLILIAILSTCKDEPSPTEPTEPPGPPIYEKEGTIGAIGGRVQITDPQSELNGCFVDIPEGALNNPTKISIKRAEGTNLYLEDTSAVVVSFLPDGIQFNKPVTIGLPYQEGSYTSNLKAYYLNIDSSIVQEIPIDSVNKASNLAIATTNHFTPYVSDDDGTRIWNTFYYYNRKISVQILIESYMQNGLFGLKAIPLSKWAILNHFFGIHNAKDIVDNLSKFGSGEQPYGIFRVTLKKGTRYGAKSIETKTLVFKRTGEGPNYRGELYLDPSNGKSPNQLQLLYKIRNQDSDEREEWFKGSPFIFHFNHTPNGTDEYFIKAEWAISPRPYFQLGMATKKYVLSTYNSKQKRGMMFEEDPDPNGNFVEDRYEKANSIPILPHNPSPYDQATNQPIDVTLKWECSDVDGDPITYDVYFSKTNPPWDNRASENQTETTFKLSNLQYQSKYYWAILAKDEFNTRPNAYIWSFWTGSRTTAPPQPTLFSPSNGATGISTITNLTWNYSNGATSYKLQISTNNSFSNLIFEQDGLTGTTKQISGLSNSTRYYWRVSASNSYGTSDYSNSWDFTTKSGGTAPQTPTLYSPSNKATNISTMPTLIWNSSSGATSYNLHISTKSTFSDTIYYLQNYVNTSFKLSHGLLGLSSYLCYSETYFWRVSASNSYGISDYTDFWYFTTESGDLPTLSYPTNGATEVNKNITFRWNSSNQAISSFYLQVSHNSSFTNLIYDQSNLTSRQSVPGLEDATKYYWRVNETNTCGVTSKWTPVWSFTTQSMEAAPDTPILYSPSNGTTNISISPTISWNSSSGAASYRLQVSTNSSFSNLYYDQSGLTSTSKQIFSLSNSTQYYWHVNASNSYGASDYSNTWSFTTSSGGSQGTPCPGIPTVNYAGQTYNTVQIGNQCWLKENLNVGTRINGTQDQSSNSTIEKYCYDDNEANCNTYGGLYQWNEAMQYVTAEGTQGICPDGWHIPTDDEWGIFDTYVNDRAGKIIALSETTNYTITNETGFSALFAGYRGGEYSDFSHQGDNTSFWSSSNWNNDIAGRLFLDFGNSDIARHGYSKKYGFSVRCILNNDNNNSSPYQPSNPSPSDNATDQSTSLTLSWDCSDPDNDPLTYDVYFGTNSNPSLKASNRTNTTYNPGTLSENTTYYWKVVAKDDHGNSTDSPIWSFSTEGGTSMGEPCPGIPTVSYAGKTYNTVQIGSQCWLRENLDVGTMITSNNSDENQTDNNIIEKYCYENNEANCNTYGGLYQWNEAMQYNSTEGAKGICPNGWHIPTYAELQTLRDAVGGSGNALKAIGQGTGNGAGMNTSGFTTLLTGKRGNSNGDFDGLERTAYIWSSVKFIENNNYSYYLNLKYYDNEVYFSSYYQYTGFSVRCLKD